MNWGEGELGCTVFFFFFLLHSVLELLPFELWLGEGKGLWNTQNELLQHGTGEGMK